MTSNLSSLTEVAPTPVGERFLDRYISVIVAKATLVFPPADITLVLPAAWVVEVIKVAQSHVLNLPLYQSPLFGVTHHNGKVLPLITVHPLFNANLPTQEVLTVLHLRDSASNIPSMGLIIDRLVGSCSQRDLPAALFAKSGADLSIVDGVMRFSLDLLPESLWQPSYWQLNVPN